MDEKGKSTTLEMVTVDGQQGFRCECGTFHPFGAYVMARWRDRLIHTCEDCGGKHLVHAGRVELTKKGEL
mgnify:CR=1 FL=1